ncbi:MAG: hypothetical protein AAGK04_02220, partial [Planctomycetota bacterium]
TDPDAPPSDTSDTDPSEGAQPMFTVSAADAKAHGLPAATISVSTDGGLTPFALPTEHAYLQLSGPPGSPFGLSVESVKAGSTETDLRNVAELRFEGQELELGAFGEIELAGAPRPAITCAAGQSLGRAYHLLALVEAPGGGAVLVDFGMGPTEPPMPTPQQLLEDDKAGPLLRSLQVSFE